jgi:hypothetical protein
MKKNEITFSKEEVQKMMMGAFIKGENWGVTYGGWFFPSAQERADRAAKDCEEVYKKALLIRL